MSKMPKGFIYVSHICPEIKEHMMYAMEDNFTGGIVPGYLRGVAIMTEAAAIKLCKVQEDLAKSGHSLKIYDSYRPESAIRAFKKWSMEPESSLTIKNKYYPNIDKAQLFELGYISERSAHNRGSTVDLTIVDRCGSELDMGSIVDFLDELSHTENPNIPYEIMQNRMFLKRAMESHGFKNYEKEWWHFQMIDEPFPAGSIAQPFDFPVA